MYSDKKRRRWILPAVLCAVVLILAGLFFGFRGRQSSDMSEETTAAIRDAVLRTARQCYAVEGMYPSGLDYLEENYGLSVNTDDYIIVYDIFASNVAPSVTVVHR